MTQVREGVGGKGSHLGSWGAFVRSEWLGQISRRTGGRRTHFMIRILFGGLSSQKRSFLWEAGMLGGEGWDPMDGL